MRSQPNSVARRTSQCTIVGSMEQSGNSAFALTFDDLSTPAARFGELLCAPHAATLNGGGGGGIHDVHFAHMALPDFASAVTYSASDALDAEAHCGAGQDAQFTGERDTHGVGRMLEGIDDEPPTKRTRVSSAGYNVKAGYAAAVPKSAEACNKTLLTAVQVDMKREPVVDDARRAQHRETVKSHTRKCREKVNEKFERLLEALPSPPCGVEVKYKAQVLEYTISVFRKLIARRHALRTDIALSSAHAVARWAGGELAGARFEEVVEKFARLYATKKNWKYAEVWMNGQRRTGTVLNGDEITEMKLNTFAKAGLGTGMRAGGMVARTFAARQAEWLPDVGGDPAAFSRADVAKECGLRVALTVPVMMRNGGCAAVLLFADWTDRTYSTLEVAEVVEFARVVGDAYAEHCGLEKKKMGRETKEEEVGIGEGEFHEGSAFTFASTQDATQIADLFPSGGIFPLPDLCGLQYADDRP